MKMFTKIKSKWDNLPLLARVSVVFISVNIIQKALSFLTSPIFTRLLTVEEFGKVNVWLSWEQMIGVVAMFCLSSGVFNNGMVDYPTKRDEFSFSMLGLSNTITIITSVVIAIIILLFGNFFNYGVELHILMLLLFITQPAYNFWITRERYEYKYKTVAYVALFCALVSPLASVVAVLCFPDYGVDARLFGAQIPLIITYAFFYFKIAKENRYHVSTTYWKAAILFNLPLIPHYFSSYILNNSDRLMIAYLIDERSAAFYSLAYSLSAVLTSIWLGVNSALIPYTYEKCKEEKYDDINRATLILLLTFACVCAGVILFAPELISFLAPDTYAESVYVVPPVVCGVFASALYYIYANVIYYHKKTKYVMVASITAALLNVVLNYIFIPKVGYIAAAYTTLISYSVQAVIDYVGLRRIGIKRLYNTKIIIIMYIALILINLSCIFLYDYRIVRYLFIAAILLCVFIFREKLLSQISAIFKSKKIKIEGEKND